MKVILSLCILCCASISNAQDLNDKRALAKSAHQLSKAAVERQEWTTAKVLLMNAFNRHPEKISYLSALYEFNRQYEPQDPQAMNEQIRCKPSYSVGRSGG